MALESKTDERPDKKDVLEEILKQMREINKNTKTPDNEVSHKTRQELDGKKVTVYVYTIIIAIGDVDSVKQLFDAEVCISFRYEEPLLEGKDLKNVDWEDAWDPRVRIANAVSVSECVKKHRVKKDENGTPEVRMSLRMKGTFKEHMELENFPFDYQALSFHVHSDWPTDDVEFEQDYMFKDVIRKDVYTGTQEFALCEHVKARRKPAAGARKKFPRYKVSTHVTRKPSYYLWNVVFVMALIMMLTFTSLCVPPDEVADRLSVTLTLLLTSVAFKFVVSQSLPTIPYLTLLDIYVISCLSVQVLTAAENAVASLVNEPKFIDMMYAYVVGGCLVILHVVLFIVVLVKMRRRKFKMRKITEKYQEYCNEVEKKKKENRNGDTGKAEEDGMRVQPNGRVPNCKAINVTQRGDHKDTYPAERKMQDMSVQSIENLTKVGVV